MTATAGLEAYPNSTPVSALMILTPSSTISAGASMAGSTPRMAIARVNRSQVVIPARLSGESAADWNYSYFTTEPTINLIHHEVVKPDGVSYIANKVREPEFIAGRDMWFRPIETRIGPDGALYICDFYNQAVVHNDTRGPQHGPANAAIRPDRDHYFGRIWRLQHKEAKQIDIPNLLKATPPELVKALNHPNSHVRVSAQRLITEKGA